MKRNSKLAGSTIAAPLLWGTTYLTVTEFLPEGRPLFVAAVRVVPASVLLLALGRRREGWWPSRRERPNVVVLALCNFALFFPLLTVAVYRLPGGVAASFGGIQPLLVAFMTSATQRVRITKRQLIVGSIAAGGVALVAIRPGAHFDLLGVGAAVAANVSFAVGVVLTKRFGTPANRLAATGWQLLIAGVVLFPLAVVVEGAPPGLTGRNVAGFGYFSLVATGVAFAIWFDGIRRLPASSPPLLGLAAPVTGATLGWAVLGQSLSAIQLVGFAMTVGAIIVGAVTAQASAPVAV